MWPYRFYNSLFYCIINTLISNYKLDSEDEKILNELDNLCGVIQNKEVLRDIILYIKLKQTFC